MPEPDPDVAGRNVRRRTPDAAPEWLRKEFRIGDYFSGDDILSRYVVVVALISNDVHRFLELIVESLESDTPELGDNVAALRSGIANLFEASEFLRCSEKRFNGVKDLHAELPEEAQGALLVAKGLSDQQSRHYLGDWVADVRNTTFHYPEMVVRRISSGNDEIIDAIDAAVDLQGAISVQLDRGALRFSFAEEIVVNAMPDLGEQPELLDKIREGQFAVLKAAKHVVVAYLRERGFDFNVDA